jgi:prepilin-type N-terminal cleavage/methylation domain-containing protein
MFKSLLKNKNLMKSKFKRIGNWELGIGKLRKGFSLTEMVITVSLFLMLAGVGVGAYYQYYQTSLVNSDVDKALTLIKFTRFKALKNATNDNYGIHIDLGTNSLTGFRGTYSPVDTQNDAVKLEQLRITQLNLQPVTGVTNEIIFAKQTGKTQNTGAFTISNNNFSYIFTINAQGVIN